MHKEEANPYKNTQLVYAFKLTSEQGYYVQAACMLSFFLSSSPPHLRNMKRQETHLH